MAPWIQMGIPVLIGSFIGTFFGVFIGILLSPAPDLPQDKNAPPAA